MLSVLEPQLLICDGFRVHVSSQHITTRQETSHFMLYDIVAY